LYLTRWENRFFSTRSLFHRYQSREGFNANSARRVGPTQVARITLVTSGDQTDAHNALATAIPAPTAGDNLPDDDALKHHANELLWDDELVSPAFVGPRLAAGAFRPAQPADACRA